MGSLRGWPQTLPGRQEQGELAAPLRQSRQLIWELSSEAILCTHAVFWKFAPRPAQTWDESWHFRRGPAGTLKFWNKHWWWSMVTDSHWCHMSRLEEKNIKTKKKHRGFEDLLQMHVKPTVDSTSAPWRRTEQDAQELKLPEKNCRIHQTTKYYTHCKTAISCSTYINSRSRWSNQ